MAHLTPAFFSGSLHLAKISLEEDRLIMLGHAVSLRLYRESVLVGAHIKSILICVGKLREEAHVLLVTDASIARGEG